MAKLVKNMAKSMIAPAPLLPRPDAVACEYLYHSWDRYQKGRRVQEHEHSFWHVDLQHAGTSEVKTIPFSSPDV